VKIFNLIENIIEKEENFLITSHIRPDGDSIGTQLALGLALQAMGKNVSIFNEDPVPKCYSFLPHADWIKSFVNKDFSFDVGIILDCSEWERLGKTASVIRNADIIVNIDHHPDSSGLGQYNYIDVSASATAEQVFLLLEHMNYPIGYDIALCLYVGILTDTGSFRYGNTTSKCHLIVSKLLELGIHPDHVSQMIYEQNSFMSVVLQGMLLINLQITPDNSIAWTSITKDMLNKIGYGIEFEPEGIISQIRSIEGVKVVVLFRDLGENKIKVNFRSKEDIDICQIAKEFNGGGHKQAAGCVIDGKLEVVEKMVIERIKHMLCI
jgi:phosphoesterase RecJ-like protein